jgi:uncharacterized membrane protein SpoIIM required for sporulation
VDFSRFLAEHRDAWRQLEQLLDDVDAQGVERLAAEDVRDLVRLYRKASADLLLARDVAARADITDYLEALVARAYTAIYAARRIRLRGVVQWFVTGWPTALRVERRYVAASWALFVAGLLAAFAATAVDPDAFWALVPSDIAGFYGEQHTDLRSERFGDMTGEDSAQFSSELMANNIRVTINAFALGLTAGVGTVAMIFYNGVLLGALAANFAAWGDNLTFWALILPHGVVEMFAMNLGGGGGLILADALVRPGRRRRLDALRARGQDALQLVGMAIPLLIFAGVVEAYITPLQVLPNLAKIGFAAFTGLALWAYVRAPWLVDSDAAADRAS